MIKLRFIQENNIGSWAIRFWTWSPWSHVEFLIDNIDNLPAGYLSAREDGVQLRPLDYCKPTKEIFGTINCSSEIAAKVLDFAISQIGKPYDFTALLSFVIHRDWLEPDSWICSELVAASFAQAEYPLLDAFELNRISPRDIMLSPLIKLKNKE